VDSILIIPMSLISGPKTGLKLSQFKLSSNFISFR